MREIKFRAWNKIHRHMMLWEELLEDFDPYEESTGSNLDFILEYQGVGEEDGVLMQYTGLKDKNGKEIYEGDVIKWLWGDKEQIDIVSYANGHFLVHDGPSDEDKYLNSHEDLWKVLRRYGKEFIGENTVEVIGNIYETPVERIDTIIVM